MNKLIHEYSVLFHFFRSPQYFSLVFWIFQYVDHSHILLDLCLNFCLFVFSMLVIEPRASCILSSNTELRPHLYWSVFWGIRITIVFGHSGIITVFKVCISSFSFLVHRNINDFVCWSSVCYLIKLISSRSFFFFFLMIFWVETVLFSNLYAFYFFSCPIVLTRTSSITLNMNFENIHFASFPM